MRKSAKLNILCLGCKVALILYPTAWCGHRKSNAARLKDVPCFTPRCSSHSYLLLFCANGWRGRLDEAMRRLIVPINFAELQWLPFSITIQIVHSGTPSVSLMSVATANVTKNFVAQSSDSRYFGNTPSFSWRFFESIRLRQRW